jgi:5-oxoprolinase (ATP-hydrolysing)
MPSVPVRAAKGAGRGGDGGCGVFVPRADDGVDPVEWPAACLPSAWPGGAPGAVGVNRIERSPTSGGRSETLGHIGSAEMEPGDVFVIETPGGGGYGQRLKPLRAFAL